MNQKSGSQVWIDVIKDLIGFEKGYVYTLRNVYANPGDVFESYFNNRGKYLSPFTLVGISLGIYYLISGLLVDWDAVSASAKLLYRDFLELISDENDVAKIERIYNEVLVPIVNLIILGLSKYLVVIVFPIQIVVFYSTSLFTRKIGYSFYHHFVSFNYYFSFSLLAINALIIISLISIWLALPFFIAFNYLFYGHFFKSYGENKALVRKAFLKGYLLALVFMMLLTVPVIEIWREFFARQ